MEKREFRKDLLHVLNNPGNRIPGFVWNRVESLPQFMAARTVLAYWAMPSEVPTEDFIGRWAGVKRIVLPLVTGDRLVLKEYCGKAGLVAGYKGVMEPSETAVTVAPDEIDFAIIPGVAFDRGLHRMGRGKGFYDRLLPSVGCIKVGVGFDCQLFDEIPTDPWDVPLDLVATPSELVGISKE